MIDINFLKDFFYTIHSIDTLMYSQPAIITIKAVQRCMQSDKSKMGNLLTRTLFYVVQEQSKKISALRDTLQWQDDLLQHLCETEKLNTANK